MRKRFFFKGLTGFEQDVQVTVVKVKDVPLQEGDMVDVLVQARVGAVNMNGLEIELVDLTPVKVLNVRRSA